VIRERYPPEDWNIYGAQASDGDNTPSDAGKTAQLMQAELLPVCQYYAYIEVGSDVEGAPMGLSGMARESDLWRTYAQLLKPDQPLAMRRVRHRREIYPVFRELFSRENAAQGATP
jgi:uncharacterized sporulation protein YeaH/YhbH (DUF444 family)